MVLIAELGVPIAGALVMAYFIFLIMKQLMDGLVGNKNRARHYQNVNYQSVHYE